ncbi:hypothetical protein ACHAXR_010078 [Thalassiosira sp. AJA248-18]
MTGSSNQLNENEIEYLALLLGIIEDQKWETLGYAMIGNPYAFQSFARNISKSSELNGLTILHACVRFDPPPEVVKLLLELVPESTSCVDCLQRTPLHIAAGTRASFPLIKLLAEAFPQACAIQDEDGKTPLHMACDDTCEIFEGDGDSKRDPSSYEVVETLIRASPFSVPVEDTDDMSALEHAILSDANIQVVRLLQNATQKQCQAQQEINDTMNKSTPSLDRPSISAPEHETRKVDVVQAKKGEFSRRRSVPRNQALAA